MIEDFKVGDQVENTRTHQVGQVVAVGNESIKVCFHGVKNMKLDSAFVMMNCPIKELRKV